MTKKYPLCGYFLPCPHAGQVRMHVGAQPRFGGASGSIKAMKQFVLWMDGRTDRLKVQNSYFYVIFEVQDGSCPQLILKSYLPQGLLWYGFDRFGRTRQFWKNGSRTRQFLEKD